MNKCQFYCNYIGNRARSAGGGGGDIVYDSIFQDIVDTCNSNRGKTYTDTVTELDSFGIMTGTFTLGTNGYLYTLSPSSDARVLDIINNDYITLSGASGMRGGVLADSKFIYGTPYSSTNLTLSKIDITDNTIITYGYLTTGFTAYQGGVLASNGCMYNLPYNTSEILRINTHTDTWDTFGDIQCGYWGAALAPNGCIYSAAYMKRNGATTQVLKLDPISNTVIEFGETTGWYSGAVAAPTGYIYAFPRSSARPKICKIDPVSDSITEFDLPAGLTASFNTGVLAPNGCIYLLPGATESSKIYKLDTFTDTITEISDKSYKNYTGILAMDGCIYCISGNTSKILKIDPGSSVNTNFQANTLLSPYLNKY